MVIVVFLQFFTRYVIPLPLPWTEEMARVLLVALTFAGASMAVRRNSHVAVSVLYRVLPRQAGRLLSTLVDLGQVSFYGLCAYLMGNVAVLMAPQRMASLDVSLAILFGFVAFGFGLMCIRACLVSLRHWRTQTSELEIDFVDSKL